MMRLKFFFCIFLLLVIISCKTVRKTRTRFDGVKTPREALLEKLHQPDFSFKWFYAKSKIEFDDSRNNQTINAEIRIKKDSVIFISVNAALGIYRAEMLITPDSVKFLDKFNKRFYPRDFNFIKQLTHMPNLNFDVLQKAILGCDFNFDKNNSTVEKIDTTYKIESSQNQIQNIIWMNAFNLTMSKKQLRDRVINQSYEMNYADYRLLADRLFSFKRKVKIVSNSDNVYTVDIDYKKVTLNEPQIIPALRATKL
jgi:Domain of unknown function (DUF4292)